MRITGHGSWEGKRIRDRDGRMGTVTHDEDLRAQRALGIRFDDGKCHVVYLSNFDSKDDDGLGIEWEFNPGHWAKIARENP